MSKKILSFCLSIGITICMLTPTFAEETIIDDSYSVDTINDEDIITEEAISESIEDEVITEDISEEELVDISDAITADIIEEDDTVTPDNDSEYLLEDGSDYISASDQDIASTSIKGAWSGEYTGVINGEQLVSRKIRLDIDKYSSLTGVFEGIANIDNGKNGIYAFSGQFDSSTGAFSFKGYKWMNNVSDFRFITFNGTLNSSTMTGTVDNNSSRPFVIKKKSSKPNNYRCKKSDILKTFYGEYDGHESERVVRRNLELRFTKITSNGEVYGTAKVTPSSKEPASYGRNGSYKFKGTVDLYTGVINLQGYEWIKKIPDFSFIKFEGYYDKVKNSIIGHTEKGIWSMPQDLTKKQTISVSKIAQKTINYKAKDLKKKAKSFNISAKAKTKITYKVTSGKTKYISVSKKGKVTLKKGAPKGTYKVTVTAARTSKYKEATKVITIKVK